MGFYTSRPAGPLRENVDTFRMGFTFKTRRLCSYFFWSVLQGEAGELCIRDKLKDSCPWVCLKPILIDFSSHRTSRPTPLPNHVKRTHPSDQLGGMLSGWDRSGVRRRVGRRPRIRPRVAEQRPPETEHLFRGDGADHPLYVQHHSVPENR